MSRGFERGGIVTGSSAESTTPMSANGQGSGAVLEGFKEGVQGVSRFIAAMSSPNPPSSYISHSANSSVSTYASKSTRLSQSSASSLGTSPPSDFQEQEEPEDEDEQVLMVQDTGATPTMSPNPAFNPSQSPRKEAGVEKASPLDTEEDFFEAAKIMNRGKVHDHDRLHFSSYPARSSSSGSRSQSPTKRSSISSSSSNSTPSSTFTPVSSMPGLALSSVAAGGMSWMGSVGKKWEELQKGAT